MKKRILSLLLVLFALSTTVNAASPLRFGLKGGLNLADVYLSELETTFSPDNYSGFHVGPTIEFMFPFVRMGIDGSVLYSQKGFKVSGKVFNTSNIDIPVNLKWKFGVPFAKVYLATGPYFSFGLGKSEVQWDGGSVRAKDFNIGWNVGGGVELFSHLQVGIAYGFGFTNSNEWTINNQLHSMLHGKDRVLTVSGTYFF